MYDKRDIHKQEDEKDEISSSSSEVKMQGQFDMLCKKNSNKFKLRVF